MTPGFERRLELYCRSPSVSGVLARLRHLPERPVLSAPSTNRLQGTPPFIVVRPGLQGVLFPAAHSTRWPVRLEVPDHPSSLRRGHRPPQTFRFVWMDLKELIYLLCAVLYQTLLAEFKTTRIRTQTHTRIIHSYFLKLRFFNENNNNNKNPDRF